MKQESDREETMYSFMVFNTAKRTLYRDFLSYYKKSLGDDFYIVSVNNPKLIQYLEEFIERRLN